MAPFDVSVIGELNLDLILYGLPPALTLEREHLATDLSITLGSSSAIFAHNLSCLGNRVAFSACIGDDPFGEICVQRLSASGVDASHIKKLRGKTTGLTVILPQRKDRFILTYPGAMYDMTDRELDLNFVFNAKHLHLSSYFLQKGIRPQLIDIFRKAKEAGLSTSLDTNDDPEDRWSGDIQLLLRYVDILLPNEDSLSQKVRILVIKRGSQGAIVRVGKEKFSAFPPVVDVVDPVGAGDTFDAGFVHQFIRGAKLEDCLKFANAAGALSVTRAGGTEAFRDSAHRETFMRKHATAAGPSGTGAARPIR